MKALVTGATGFVGSAIVRELLKDGVEVRVLVLQNGDTRNIDGLDVEIVYGDIRDSDSIKSALKGCDTLYQAAALCALWAPDSKVFYDINVEGTKTALNAALEQGIEKVVYTSTCATVGAHGIDNPASEEAEFNLWNTGDHYSRSKYLGEIEALKICEKGLLLITVNPAIAVGVGDIGPGPSGKLMLSILNKRMPGYIKGGGNIIDVEDVARGHILAARKGIIGQRYILGNDNMAMAEYFKLIEEVSGLRAPRFRIPYPIALIMGYIYQFTAKITRKPPVITAPMVRIARNMHILIHPKLSMNWVCPKHL